MSKIHPTAPVVVLMVSQDHPDKQWAPCAPALDVRQRPGLEWGFFPIPQAHRHGWRAWKRRHSCYFHFSWTQLAAMAKTEWCWHMAIQAALELTLASCGKEIKEKENTQR